MRVAVIGQGYVGLTLAAGAFEAGHIVRGIDKNHDLVKRLNSGLSHIEGISNNSIEDALDKSSYKATTDFGEIKGFEIVVIAVPTPLDSHGNPDITMLEEACDSLAPFVNSSTLIINESTSFVGTLRNVISPRIKKANESASMFAVSPERVDPGNTLFDLENTPRLVGGLSSHATQLAREFYSTFCKEVVEVSSPEVAEAAKLLENSFRFVNIGFINEFTQLMNSLKIPATEVINAAATKPYGFMKFTPNVGIGGHCIPVDPHYLQKNAQEVGRENRYIALSEKINEEMASYFVNRLEEFYGRVYEKSILVIGVSYKPNVADTRETPAERLIIELKSRGAFVFWHDPLVSEFMNSASSSVSGDYDVGLVLVSHEKLDFKSWNGNPIYCVNEIPTQPDWIPVLGAGSEK
jgi:UDP-N-acetyl-D-glucosamine dehydrogenase